MSDAAPWFVVLNWHGRADTLALLESLCAEPVRVVVVDNGSDDGTLDAVSVRFPSVATLQTGSNLGYAGGNNAGIRYALENGAGVVGVLNNDTLVERGFLTPLLAVLTQPGETAVSPDIRYADEPDVSWFRGCRLDRRTAWPVHLLPDEQPAAGGPPSPTEVLTGCCIVATAATWRRVGLFDERLFLMFEDSDWSMRARTAGVRLAVVPQSRIWHRVSRSFTGTAGTLGAYYFARNGTVFAWRHLGHVAAARFVSRHVVRPLPRRLTGSRPEAVMSLLGVLAAATGRRGRAGATTSRIAHRATGTARG